MSLVYFNQFFATTVSTLSLVTISNLLLVNTAHAFGVTFQNGGFESGTSNWSTIGDVTTRGAIDGINPTNGSSQAIITNGYIPGNYAAPVGNRDDDNSLDFNESGTNPVSADTNPDTDLLQEHLTLNTDAFSIDRVGGTLEGITPRTSKEGSGMYQEFDVTIGAGDDSFTISFDWAYLTNDGVTTLGGEQDFAFWNLGLYDPDTDSYTTAFSSNEEIEVLESSFGPINDPTPGVDDYSKQYDYGLNARETYTVSGLAPGDYTYRVGFGVVDVDGLDYTSALMLDDIEVIPFEFSPSAGIGLVLGLFGIKKLHNRKNKS